MRGEGGVLGEEGRGLGEGWKTRRGLGERERKKSRIRVITQAETQVRGGLIKIEREIREKQG